MIVEAYVKKIKVSFARSELGLTQRELAELSGISQVTIFKAENGESIRLLTAQAILKALNKQRKAEGLPALDFEILDWKVQGEE
jgi:predicted transcriptional regulator